MTDADVDGAHIRTLVLTLLFREMPELIEAGYIYIAKPPLYKLKQGRNERYIEKESELEEVLLADKFEKISVTTASARVQAHRGALAALHAACSSSTRAGPARCAPSTATRRSASSRRPRCSTTRRRPSTRSSRTSAGGRRRRPHETTHRRPTTRCSSSRPSSARPAWPRRTACRRALFESNDYRQFVKVNAQLVELAGAPPFSVALGDRVEQALSFEALRTAVLEVARRGINVQRFKGLGEMNADQLRETTMDPATRTLQQVTSRTPPRPTGCSPCSWATWSSRAATFIEQNARAVANLDV